MDDITRAAKLSHLPAKEADHVSKIVEFVSKIKEIPQGSDSGQKKVNVFRDDVVVKSNPDKYLKGRKNKDGYLETQTIL